MRESNPTPLTFEILLALCDEARHGYGIIKEIEGRGGRPPSTGALYLALQRMERDAFIEEDATPRPSGDDRRRYYRITERGRATAEAESARLAALVEAARSKRLLVEGPA